MLHVKRARPDQVPSCLAIRHEVFVLHQGVPPELDVDGRDPACVHVIAMIGNESVGTGRLRITRENPPRAKAERVAVRPPWQGRGVGAALMRALEEEAAAQGFHRLVLSAQEAVRPFYEGLGYTPDGDLFMEASIPHRRMHRTLLPDE